MDVISTQAFSQIDLLGFDRSNEITVANKMTFTVANL